MPGEVPCPFTYADGRRCTGHVRRVEVYHCKIFWEQRDDGSWLFDYQPGTHYHLFCSEKDNHAGIRRGDDERMKFWPQHLPEEVAEAIDSASLR